MKTNWRNQGSFLLPSQEANPNNMKLPKPRSSFAQKRVRIPWESDIASKKAKWGLTLSSTKSKRRVLSTNVLLGLLFSVCKHPYIFHSHLSQTCLFFICTGEKSRQFIGFHLGPWIKVQLTFTQEKKNKESAAFNFLSIPYRRNSANRIFVRSKPANEERKTPTQTDRQTGQCG